MEIKKDDYLRLEKELYPLAELCGADLWYRECRDTDGTVIPVFMFGEYDSLYCGDLDIELCRKHIIARLLTGVLSGEFVAYNDATEKLEKSEHEKERERILAASGSSEYEPGIKTYEGFIAVKAYIPARVQAPDAGTAVAAFKKIQEIVGDPGHMNSGWDLSCPEIKEVDPDDKMSDVKAPEFAPLSWLDTAYILGIVRDPGEENQYRD